jgi:murein DD-endopeptidase MepM/ murein hydrolase activator NlpD
MKAPFSLVVVYGDGSRVLRFCLPRWIAYGTVGSVAAVVAAAVGFSGEYVLFQRQWGQMATLRRRADDQHELIASFKTRIAAVRSEILVWKALHAKMWKALGRDARPDQTRSEVAGGTPDAQDATAGVKPPLGGELERLASCVAEEGPRLRELEHAFRRTSKIMSALPIGWPVRGKVNSEYGMRRSPWSGARQLHAGIDIGGPKGTPVTAPAAGTVVSVSSHGGYGKHVTLLHANGVRSRYAHLKELDVQVGQQVEKGQVIGLMGSTGHSTGPHLHYEVLVEGKRVNPREFLGDR